MTGADQVGGAVCPAGHALFPHKDPDYDYTCDQCEADVPTGAVLWGCRRCDWDVCTECRVRLTASEAARAAESVEVRVYTLGGQECVVRMPACSRACEAKVRLAERLGVPAEQQRLLAGTRELLDVDALWVAGKVDGPVLLTLLLRQDEEIEWLARVREDGQDGLALMYAAEALREDRGVAAAAVRRTPGALAVAGEAPRGDPQIIMAAVQRNGLLLEFAAESLQADRAIVMTAVRQAGGALRYAAAALRQDRAVVLAALAQDGLALEFAGEALREDSEVLRAALQQAPLALRHAAQRLREDRELVLEATRKDSRAWEFAARSLQDKYRRFLPDQLRVKL